MKREKENEKGKLLKEADSLTLFFVFKREKEHELDDEFRCPSCADLFHFNK
jgi:hypothetical protein